MRRDLATRIYPSVAEAWTAFAIMSSIVSQELSELLGNFHVESDFDVEEAVEAAEARGLTAPWEYDGDYILRIGEGLYLFLNGRVMGIYHDP